MPGNVFVFPGHSIRQGILNGKLVDGIHHLTLRDAGDELVVYARQYSADDIYDRKSQLSEQRLDSWGLDPELIHVMTSVVPDPSQLIDAGLAVDVLSEGAFRSIKARGAIWDDALVENHLYETVPERPPWTDERALAVSHVLGSHDSFGEADLHILEDAYQELGLTIPAEGLGLRVFRQDIGHAFPSSTHQHLYTVASVVERNGPDPDAVILLRQSGAGVDT